jgi:phosphoribosyl-ATP pyrophosphohydrolase
MKDNENKNISFEDTLIRKSRILSKSKNETDRLISAIVFSSFAEEIADLIFARVSLEVDKALLKSNYYLIKDKIKRNEHTNLEASISRLEYYEFPSKRKVLELLKIIKSARNNLFHNLFKLSEKGLKPNNLMNDIQINTEKLIDIWKKTFYL